MIGPLCRGFVAGSVALILACCGDDDGSVGSATTSVGSAATSGATASGVSSSVVTTTAGSATTTTSNVPLSTTAPTPTSEEPDDINWPPWGPGDPLIPQQYAALVPGSPKGFRCEAVRGMVPDGDEDGFSGHARPAVPSAIRDGSLWPAATSAPDPPPADNEFQDCLNRELASMLNDALAWHRDHPDSQPHVSYAAPGSLSPCQQRVYEVKVNEYAPDTDHPVGGLSIELLIPGLPNSGGRPTIVVDGEEASYLHGFSGAGSGLGRGIVFLSAPVGAHRGR